MVQDPNNGVYIPKKEAIKKKINGKSIIFQPNKAPKNTLKKIKQKQINNRG
ncbi:MAG: hypothetical protein CM1200mP16_07420 [Nitrospina sp.]|nr:MAG: hypothetical protein CM1200mP16_07420 [Nitrospina sp.]